VNTLLFILYFSSSALCVFFSLCWLTSDCRAITHCLFVVCLFVCLFVVVVVVVVVFFFFVVVVFFLLRVEIIMLFRALCISYSYSFLTFSSVPFESGQFLCGNCDKQPASVWYDAGFDSLA
jgi:hypothetical protein